MNFSLHACYMHVATPNIETALITKIPDPQEMELTFSLRRVFASFKCKSTAATDKPNSVYLSCSDNGSAAGFIKIAPGAS